MFSPGGALGSERMPLLAWRAAEQTPKVCFRVLETNHPMTTEDLSSKVVKMPKATRIILRFDPLSHLETGDVVAVLAGESKTAKSIWRAGRHDVARNGWPGVDAPGLVIQGDTFRVTLERLMSFSAGDTAYGYRIIAEAEMPPEAVPSMQKQCDASPFVCASILSEARFSVTSESFFCTDFLWVSESCIFSPTDHEPSYLAGRWRCEGGSSAVQAPGSAAEVGRTGKPQ